MMGHTNISSTQVYAKVTDDKISGDTDRLMERRKMNGKTKRKRMKNQKLLNLGQ